MHGTRHNVQAAVLAGLVMATLYLAYVGLLYMLRGPEPFANNSTTLYAVVLTYYMAGTLGGVVVGLLRPLTRRLAGAVLAGVLVALIFFFCVGIAMTGPFWRWEVETWRNVLSTALILGVPTSMILWWQHR